VSIGPAAVLFDMDGTLLDSEKVWDIALADLARWLGGELSESARTRMVGSSLARSIAILHADLDIDADPETSGHYLLTRTEALFYTSLVWKPGAEKLLAAVRDAALPAALVTSTHRRLTEVALDVIGRQYFAVTVCGDEVGHPKPHPEPYLKAVGLLGLAAADCLVIEDSPLGIASAEAAGAAVLAIPSEVDIEPASRRVIRNSLQAMTVEDLRQVFRALRQPSP